LDRHFPEAVDKLTELVEDDDERFSVADVMELEVETRQKVFGVAAMNPSPRYSGDHEYQIYMEVARAVLCNMVLLAKLKNPLKRVASFIPLFQ
jgi:glycine cleavage system aminomethyltransferase T